MDKQISGVRPLIDVMAFAEAPKDGESSEPPTRIKLVPVGTYKTRAYGSVNFTKEAIQEMANHFNEGIRAGGKDAGLPIDVEHGDSQYKGAAAGWIKQIFAEDDGGYGEIEWTPLGKDLLKNKIYKFYSPEIHPTYIDPEHSDIRLNNVMTGGGLVNKPMFKKDLPPLMMSEAGIEADQNALLTGENKSYTLFLELSETTAPKTRPMNLKDIIAKTANTRSTDEQRFLVDHKDELTFAEAKAEGLAEDKKIEVKTPEKDTKITAGEGDVVIEADEFNKLKEMAAEGVAANTALKRAGVKKEVETAIFSESGAKLPTDQVDKWTDRIMKMDETDKTETLEMLKALPEKKVFGETGSDKAITGSSAAGVELDKKAKELMATNKGMQYSEAISRIASENPQMYDEYSTNLPIAGVER